MSVVPDLLARNRRFAQQRHQALPIRPTRPAIVVSCVDARADPAHLFGLEPGEALVIRNAGGRVTRDVEEQLAVLVGVAGGPDVEVVLVHHTECGVENFAKEEVRQAVHAKTGIPLASMEQLAIHDHDESLREDLERLRSSDVVPRGIMVVGIRYDAATGQAEQRFAEVL